MTAIRTLSGTTSARIFYDCVREAAEVCPTEAITYSEE